MANINIWSLFPGATTGTGSKINESNSAGVLGNEICGSNTTPCNLSTVYNISNFPNCGNSNNIDTRYYLYTPPTVASCPANPTLATVTINKTFTAHTIVAKICRDCTITTGNPILNNTGRYLSFKVKHTSCPNDVNVSTNVEYRIISQSTTSAWQTNTYNGTSVVVPNGLLNTLPYNDWINPITIELRVPSVSGVDCNKTTSFSFTFVNVCVSSNTASNLCISGATSLPLQDIIVNTIPGFTAMQPTGINPTYVWGTPSANVTLNTGINNNPTVNINSTFTVGTNITIPFSFSYTDPTTGIVCSDSATITIPTIAATSTLYEAKIVPYNNGSYNIPNDTTGRVSVVAKANDHRLWVQYVFGVKKGSVTHFDNGLTEKPMTTISSPTIRQHNTVVQTINTSTLTFSPGTGTTNCEVLLNYAEATGSSITDVLNFVCTTIPNSSFTTPAGQVLNTSDRTMVINAVMNSLNSIGGFLNPQQDGINISTVATHDPVFNRGFNVNQSAIKLRFIGGNTISTADATNQPISFGFFRENFTTSTPCGNVGIRLCRGTTCALNTVCTENTCATSSTAIGVSPTPTNLIDTVNSNFNNIAITQNYTDMNVAELSGTPISRTCTTC